MPSISNNFEKKKVLWCCCFRHQLHLTEIWHHTNSAINIKLNHKEIQNIPRTKSNDGKETVESISNHQYKFIKGTHCHRTTSNLKVQLLTLILLHSFHCTFCAQKKTTFYMSRRQTSGVQSHNGLFWAFWHKKSRLSS